MSATMRIALTRAGLTAAMALFVLLAGRPCAGQQPPVLARASDSGGLDDPDLVFGWEASQPRRGIIRGLDENYLRFEQILSDGVTRAQVSIPRQAVRRVDFGRRAGDEALLASGDVKKLAAAWEERSDLLGVEDSEVGKIGLAYAEALLARGAAEDAVQAMELFTRIESEDWSPVRQALARSGKLRAMIAAGRADEAVAEAEQLAEQTEDPSVIIEAKFVLASAARNALTNLIKENPRWQEDDWVKPERDRLYNRALDLLLYPYLFHGTRAAEAARGLWGAVEVYMEAGEDVLAAETAADLVALYKGTPEASRAASLLERTQGKEGKPDAATTRGEAGS